MRSNPGVVMAAVALTLTTVARAQSPFIGGVDLEDVVTSVLAGSPDIEQGRLAVEAEAAARFLAASPFDLEVRTAVLRARDSLPVASARNGLLVTETVETSASAAKSFRLGVVASAEFSLGRVRSSASGLPTDQSHSSISVLVPLAGGRGGGAAAGAELAARESYAASLLERDHIAARAVHDAVVAYWRYLAAHEQLRTYGESADRARRLVEETEVLIRADERPASDLDVMASNQAQKQTAVTAARQNLLDAKYALGISMGLAAETIPTLGLPSSRFPEAAVNYGAAPRTSARAAVARAALSARRDLAALRIRRAGARLAWEGSLRDLRARWDVVARIGYIGFSRDLPPGAASTPARGGGGPQGVVQVQYEPAATNRAVRGRALGTAASHRAVSVATDDLARRIEANVLVAMEALHNASEEAAIAREAVRLSERSVLTEQEKFSLGLATLFDAILAEDSLTNARLRQTNARFRFAVALVRLRFETGTLLDVTGGTVSVNPNRMTSFVFEERKP